MHIFGDVPPPDPSRVREPIFNIPVKPSSTQTHWLHLSKNIIQREYPEIKFCKRGFAHRIKIPVKMEFTESYGILWKCSNNSREFQTSSEFIGLVNWSGSIKSPFKICNCSMILHGHPNHPYTINPQN